MKVTVIPIEVCVLGTISKGLVRELEGLEIGKWIETIQNTAFVEVGQNTEKSFGDLRWLADIQTPGKDPQLTLVWQTRKE